MTSVSSSWHDAILCFVQARQRRCLERRCVGIWLAKWKVRLVMCLFEGADVIFAVGFFQTACGLLHQQIGRIARSFQFFPHIGHVTDPHLMISICQAGQIHSLSVPGMTYLMLPDESRKTCIIVAHVSWVGSVRYRSCTTSHNDALESRLSMS